MDGGAAIAVAARKEYKCRLVSHSAIPFFFGVPVTNFSVNGKKVSVDVDADTPLLWVLRDELGLTGTKYGCGVAQCGACTVHVDGQPRRSCVTPISAVAGRRGRHHRGPSGTPSRRGGQEAPG